MEERGAFLLCVMTIGTLSSGETIRVLEAPQIIYSCWMTFAIIILPLLQLCIIDTAHRSAQSYSSSFLSRCDPHLTRSSGS